MTSAVRVGSTSHPREEEEGRQQEKHAGGPGDMRNDRAQNAAGDPPLQPADQSDADRGENEQRHSGHDGGQSVGERRGRNGPPLRDGAIEGASEEKLLGDPVDHRDHQD